MPDSLKKKASTALFWSFIDKGGLQIIQMLIVCILARLLDPSEFGLMAVLTIFSVIAIILQESGFFSALIRKKDADETDYSSVFYFNITISIVIYLILFFCSPLIANYFEQPILTNLSRVVFLAFVFNAFGVVQNVHINKNLDFKTNTKITFISGIVSGIIAVAMALNGFGVWSLAVQLVAQSFIRCILLWLFVRWFPVTGFKADRIRQMFGYSVNLLINSLINQISTRIYSLIIAKHFSLTDAGYYDQAYKLNNIPHGTIGTSIQGVAFPILSKLDDIERIKRIYRKIVRISVFIAFPLAMFTIVGAESIISILLSDKWASIIPYLQILAVGWAFYPPLCLVSSLLQAIGKSALILKLELVRSCLYIGVAIISVACGFGILGLVWGFTAVNIVTYIINNIVSGKDIGYKISEAFKDIAPYLVISFVAFAPLYFLNQMGINKYILLFLQLIVGGGLYLLIVRLLGSQVLADCIDFIKGKKADKE